MDFNNISVESTLFSSVKYVIGGTVDERLIKLLEDGGAQLRKYSTIGVSHFFAGHDCNEITMDEAKDVFDIPVVSPRWIWFCAKLNKVIPVDGFEIDHKRLFSSLTFTTSSIHGEDLNALWANITYYGGVYTTTLNKHSSYLITNETNGKKFTLAKENGIKIVCTDYVIDCIKAGELIDHESYHPELLTSGPEIPASTLTPATSGQNAVPRAISVFSNKSQPFARPRSQATVSTSPRPHTSASTSPRLQTQTSTSPRSQTPSIFHQQNSRQLEAEKLSPIMPGLIGSKGQSESTQSVMTLPYSSLQRSVSNAPTTISSQPALVQTQTHQSYSGTAVSEQSTRVFQQLAPVITTQHSQFPVATSVQLQSPPSVVTSSTQQPQFQVPTSVYQRSQSSVVPSSPQHIQFQVPNTVQHQTQSSVIPVTQQHPQFSVATSAQHHLQPSIVTSSPQHSQFSIPTSAPHQSQPPTPIQSQFSVPTSLQHQSLPSVPTSTPQQPQFHVPTSVQHQSQPSAVTSTQQQVQFSVPTSAQSQPSLVTSTQQQLQFSVQTNTQSQSSLAANSQQQLQFSIPTNPQSQPSQVTSAQQQLQFSVPANTQSQPSHVVSAQQQLQYSVSTNTQSQHPTGTNVQQNIPPALTSPQQQSQHSLQGNQHQQSPPVLIQHMSPHSQSLGIQNTQQQSTFHSTQQHLMDSQNQVHHLTERAQQGTNVPIQSHQQPVFQQQVSMSLGMNYQQVQSSDSPSNQQRVFQQTNFQDSIRLQERQYQQTNVLETHLSQGSSFQQTQSQPQISNFQSNSVPNMEPNSNMNQSYINRPEMNQPQLQQFIQSQNISQIQNRTPGMSSENHRIQYIQLQPQSRMQFQPGQRPLHPSQFNQQQQVETVRRQIQEDPQIRAQWLQMDQQQRSLLIQKLAQRNRDEHIRREMMARQQQLNAQNQNRGIVIQSGGTVIQNSAQTNPVQRAPMGQMQGDMQTQGPQQMINVQGFTSSGQPQPHQYQHQVQSNYPGNHPSQSQDVFMHPSMQRPRLRFNPPPRVQHQVPLQYQQGQQMPPQQRLAELSPQAQDNSFGGQNLNQQEKISQHQMYTQNTQTRAVVPQQFPQSAMQPDHSSPDQNSMNPAQGYFQTRPQVQNQILVTQGQGGTILRTDQVLSSNFDQPGVQRLVGSPQQQHQLHDNQHQQKVLHANYVLDPQAKPQPPSPIILTQPQPGLGSPRSQQVLPPQSPQQRINVRHVVVQGNQQQHIILQAQSVPGSPGMQWANPNSQPQAKGVTSPGQIQRPRLAIDQQSQPPNAQQWIRTSIQGQNPPQGNIIYTNQSNMPFVQVVNSKTKTALANLLSNRLMGSSPEGSSAPVSTIVSRSPSPHHVAQSPLPTTVQMQSRPALTQTTSGMNLQQQQVLMQRRTLSNLTNSEKISQSSPAVVRTQQHGGASSMITPRTQYYGHDPNIKLPSDGFLLGCIFWVAQLPNNFDKNLDQLVTRLGGEMEKTYSPRVTHVLCENQMFPEFQHCLREGKRVVTLHWLNDVFKRKCVTTPFYALHLPVPFTSDFKPFKGDLIGITGYNGEDLQRVRAMCNILGLVLTPVFSKANMALIAAKPTGKKYNKAREWRKAVINIQFLNEVMFGHAASAKIMMHSPKYQQFSLDQPFRFDIALVAQLLAAWKFPIRVSNEALEKFRTMKRTLDSLKADEPEEIKSKRPKLEEEEDFKSIEIIENHVLAEPSTVPQLILLTGFSENFKEMIIKKIGHLGAEVTENIDLASIVIFNNMQLTKKLVLSICKMKDIVSLDWLRQSLIENKFLDPGPFIPAIVDGVNFKELLQKPNRHLLFCGYTFYLSPSIYHVQSDLPEIIEAAGGAIDRQKSLKSIIKLANNSRRYIIVTYPADNYLFDESFNNREKFRDIGRDNILNWILNQKVVTESA